MSAPPHLPPSLGSVPPLLESFPVSISDVLGPAVWPAAGMLLQQNKLKTVCERRGKSGPGRSPGCSGFPLL